MEAAMGYLDGLAATYLKTGSDGAAIYYPFLRYKRGYKVISTGRLTAIRYWTFLKLAVFIGPVNIYGILHYQDIGRLVWLILAGLALEASGFILAIGLPASKEEYKSTERAKNISKKRAWFGFFVCAFFLLLGFAVIAIGEVRLGLLNSAVFSVLLALSVKAIRLANQNDRKIAAS